jgi:hypothetical protein
MVRMAALPVTAVDIGGEINDAPAGRMLANNNRRPGGGGLAYPTGFRRVEREGRDKGCDGLTPRQQRNPLQRAAEGQDLRLFEARQDGMARRTLSRKVIERKEIRLAGVDLVDLDEIAAGVMEDSSRGHTTIRWLHCILNL